MFLIMLVYLFFHFCVCVLVWSSVMFVPARCIRILTYVFVIKTQLWTSVCRGLFVVTLKIPKTNPIFPTE